jgi:rubredoxin
MEKYKCTVCDCIYDPAIGDPDGGIEPGISLESLPQDWVCPECGVDKKLYESIG